MERLIDEEAEVARKKGKRPSRGQDGKGRKDKITMDILPKGATDVNERS